MLPDACDGEQTGLGRRIAARFKSIGLREGEEFKPLQVYKIRKCSMRRADRS
jgi:hypothetical protein